MVCASVDLRITGRRNPESLWWDYIGDDCSVLWEQESNELNHPSAKSMQSLLQTRSALEARSHF